jgi:hypothetical protein
MAGGECDFGQALEIALRALRSLLAQHLGFGQIGKGGEKCPLQGLGESRWDQSEGISR